MKKIAILQSNYIPWKGYFDIINKVDEFILYDDMQYTSRDWRNRNKIMTPNGPIWLTIPVEHKGNRSQKINETKVVDTRWIDEHMKALQLNYGKSKCFNVYKNIIFDLYESLRNEKYLSIINYSFIIEICKILDIHTKISWSSDYQLVDGKTERLIQLVKDAGGGYYLSGPAAKDYIEEDKLNEAGIELEWMDYSGYKEYSQMGPRFEHGVSIIDLLFNEGENSPKYLKSIL